MLILIGSGADEHGDLSEGREGHKDIRQDDEKRPRPEDVLEESEEPVHRPCAGPTAHEEQRTGERREVRGLRVPPQGVTRPA